MGDKGEWVERGGGREGSERIKKVDKGRRRGDYGIPGWIRRLFFFYSICSLFFIIIYFFIFMVSKIVRRNGGEIGDKESR